MPSQTAYLAAVERIRAQVDERVRAMWNRLPNYRDLDIDRFVAAVVPLVQAGQLRVAELTSAYFETGGVDRALVLNGRGVDAGEVYRRPAVTVYTELAAGKSMSEAVKAGAARLSSLAATDLQMAKVRQAQASLTSKGVKQYRRVLTGNENCALCVIASTQRYWVRNLSPIHPGCDCAVDVMPPDWDPRRQVIDRDLLESTHQQILSHVGETDRNARDLGLGKRDASGRWLSDFTDLIVTRTHGEYGPVLTWRGQHFTGPADF